jgi:hypothetical protein
MFPQYDVPPSIVLLTIGTPHSKIDIIWGLSKDMHDVASAMQPDRIIDEIIKGSMSFSWEDEIP